MAKHKPPPKKRRFQNRPLKELSRIKRTLTEARAERARGQAPVPTNPTEAHRSTEGEARLFQEAMAGVEPMEGGKVNGPRVRLTSPASHEEQERQEVMQALRDLVEGEGQLSIHETDEAIEGAVEGFDPRMLRKLRRGEFSVQDHLDLHGHTRDEARERVETFLLNAMAQGKRCVLIIHGRGHRSKDHTPVLKNALTSWFSRRALRKKILAFTTARPVDGGAGAVYVLLRKYQRPVR